MSRLLSKICIFLSYVFYVLLKILRKKKRINYVKYVPFTAPHQHTYICKKVLILNRYNGF